MSNLTFLDFETYFDSDYSLKKMTTEEYLRDYRYETIGVSVQHEGGEPQWYTGSEQDIAAWLHWQSLDVRAVVAHNAKFDMAILNWKFGIRPKLIIDTQSMAKGTVGLDTGVSLKKLGEYFNLPLVKGADTEWAKGLRREEFTPAQMEQYGRYCCNDTAMTRLLLQKLAPMVPDKEMKLIDWTIRCFTEPVLELDKDLIDLEYRSFLARRGALLQAAGVTDIAELRSDERMAQLLINLGAVPPTKISPNQKNEDGSPKEVWAFAKSDPEFMDMREHEDEAVVALVEARLGSKTSQVQSRLERFAGIASRGTLPVPLMYCGATPTRRWSGEDKINLQNLPRNKKGQLSPLRRAIRAPAGMKMAVADLSQIELRVNAWQTRQDDILETLRNGGDTYSDMATSIFGFPVDKYQHPVERFVGKTAELGCFAASTPVLTRRGVKPIVSITKDDELWDGVQWIRSKGARYMGCKPTVAALGVVGTGDHEVLGLFGWRPLQRHTVNTRCRLSALAKGIWLLKGMHSSERRSLLSSAAAAAEPPRGQPRTTGVKGEAHDATPARNGPAASPNLHSVMPWWARRWARTRCWASRALTRYAGAHVAGETTYVLSTTSPVESLVQPAHATDAKATPGGLTPRNGTYGKRGITCVAGSAATHQSSGGRTGVWRSAHGGRSSRGSLLTQFISQVGKVWFEVSFWIALTARAATVLRTAGGPTPEPARATFDVIDAGPNNRFTVVPDGVPVVVHNCGYQCGAKKFHTMLRVDSRKYDIPLEDESFTFAENVVATYRSRRVRIKNFWYEAGDAIEALALGGTRQLGPYTIREQKLLLPDGSHLYYPDLKLREKKGEDEIGVEWSYMRMRYRNKVQTKIYGGKLVENITQAVARLFISDALLRLLTVKYQNGQPVFRVVNSVHDEIVVLYEAGLEDSWVKDVLRWALTTVPEWAPDIPLDYEGEIGYDYSSCK